MQEKLKPFTLIANKDELEKISKKILDSHSVEIVPVEKVANAQLIQNLKSSVDNPYKEIYENFLSIFNAVGKKPEPQTQQVSFPYSEDPQKIREFSKTLKDEMQKLNENMRSLKEQNDRVETYINFFEKLKGLKFDLGNLQKMKFLKYKVGKINSVFYQRLIESIKEMDIIIADLTHEKDFDWIFIIYDPNIQIEKVLSLANFVEYSIPQDYSGTGEEILLLLHDKKKSLEYEINILNMSIRKLFYENRKIIYRYSDYIFVMKNIYDLAQNVGYTDNFLVISGWTTKQFFSELEEYANSNEYSILLDYTFKEKAPTLLKNKGIFKRFEFIVKMFSTPSSNEIDPTPIVTILFLLFFGMMFGDVGHGLVLSLFGFIINKIRKSDLFYILGVSGISSMIFGVLYGSVFGYETIIEPLWKRPMSSIDYFLMVSIYFGMAVITLAMILNIINKIKNNEKIEVLFDPNGISGVALYWIAIADIFYYLRNGTFLKITLGFIISFIIAIYLRGIIFEKGKLGEKMVRSFFELFESLLGYLSNTLSFIRLGAFALNHAGLFLAFYMMSQMAKNPATSFIVLLIGNILIIGLEGLVVFIQTLRLNYYEFFMKFFKGNGREFNPITYQF